MTKIRITCPDCRKYFIGEISKEKGVITWTHECNRHYFFVEIEVKLESK